MKRSYDTNKYTLESRVKDVFSVEQGHPGETALYVLEILERERQTIQKGLDDAYRALEVAEAKAAAFRLIVDGVTGQLATLRTDTALLASLARSKGATDPIGVVQAARAAAMCQDGALHGAHNHFVAGDGLTYCPGIDQVVCELVTYHHEHSWGYPFDTQNRCPGRVRPTD